MPERQEKKMPMIAPVRPGIPRDRYTLYKPDGTTWTVRSWDAFMEDVEARIPASQNDLNRDTEMFDDTLNLLENNLGNKDA